MISLLILIALVVLIAVIAAFLFTSNKKHPPE